MKPISLLSLLLPALVPMLPAQGPDHLVGITRFTPMLRHHDHNACAPIAQCALAGMPNSAALPPWAGGTAWNPVRSGAWVTNGVAIAQYDDGCNVQCPPMPIPTLAPGNVITGLELVEGLNQLWMIDSGGILHQYTNSCPPTPIAVCNTGLALTAVGNVTSGLAVDEGNGIVFISYTTFPLGFTRIMVSNIAAPCAIVSQFPWPACTVAAGGPVLGLACDWGNRFLYGTDGATTTRVSYAWAAPNVLVTGVNCCPAIAVNEPMIGLAVRPGRATPAGQSCANGTCAPCPQVHSLRNDPSLGNAAFALGLDQAPAGAIAILAIGAGPCLMPGAAVPPLCGPLHTIPLLGTVGPNLTGGTGICDGSTTFNIPLPVAPGLAGLVYSSQAITLCFGGGWGMSNCLSWQLQGN